MRYSSLRKYSWLIVILFLLQSACTKVVRPDHYAQPDKYRLGRIGIVVGNFDPTYDFTALTDGKVEGSVKGALDAMAGCGEMIRSDDSGVAVILAIIVCLPVAATIGAITGANSAESSEIISTAQSNLQSQIANLTLQEHLRNALIQYSNNVGLKLSPLSQEAGPAKPDDMPAYHEFSDEFDTVLEVVTLEFVARTSGARGVPTSIQLKAKVRVVNTHDGSISDTFPVVSTGITRSVERWLADNAKPVQDGIAAAIREVAETAIDEVLLIYHPTQLVSDQPSQETAEEDGNKSQRHLVPGYALRPIEPPLRNKFYWNNPTWGHLERFQLVSLEPTFEWEPFPRGFDIVVGHAPGQAMQILYDFRIYDWSGIVVYGRTGLEVPRHKLETRLQPCMSYRWTVRSRFHLNGLPRATEWTGAFNTIGGEVAPWWWRRGSKPALVMSLPNIAYYPIIETPGDDEQTCSGR